MFLIKWLGERVCVVLLLILTHSKNLVCCNTGVVARLYIEIPHKQYILEADNIEQTYLN